MPLFDARALVYLSAGMPAGLGRDWPQSLVRGTLLGLQGSGKHGFLAKHVCRMLDGMQLALPEEQLESSCADLVSEH